MDDVERIEIRLPKKLAQRLRSSVPARRRSAWIAEVIEDALRLGSRIEAIDRSFGTWTDEDFPGLDTVEDIERWRASLWSGSPFRRSEKNRRREIGRSCLLRRLFEKLRGYRRDFPMPEVSLYPDAS